MNMRLIALLPMLLLLGCTSLKKAAIVAGAASAGAVVGSVVSGTVGAGVGALTTATAADLVTGVSNSGATNMDCAPDNFWTLLGNLVSVGGWLLILIFVVPLVLGYLIPGPGHEKRKKQKIVQTMPTQDS